MFNQSNGFNPMRWDCGKNAENCFNKKCRPKIEVFSDCFPGRINFGDIDGIVEMNSRGLFLEWKSFSKNIPIGQKITFEHLTKSGSLSAITILGNAETMEIKEFCWFKNGIQGRWWEADLEQTKKQIKNWVESTKIPLR